MPNHCENDLYLSGKEGDVAEVLKFIGADKEPAEFDFNAVIPYPERLRQMDEEIPKWGDPERTQKLVGYKAKYGTESDGYNSGGYEWCHQNWGTKWNAYEVERRDRNRDYGGEKCVTFQTAWCPPVPVISALEARFPNVTFYFEWFEGGMGNCGGFTCLSVSDDNQDEEHHPGKISSQWEGKYLGHRGG